MPLTVADCPAGYNIIQGSSTADTLTGTAGNDCILGHGGNDAIDGLGGNDFLIGGAGIDTILGGDGDDILHGEDNGDRLEGQGGADTLYGGGALDTILGGDGNDIAYGGDGADTIEGGLGDDALYGEIGSDIIRGGGGADRIFGGSETDQLYGDDGDDIIDGGTAGDRIEGGAGHDVLQGGPQNDVIFGDDGNDAILGGKHVNTIDGGIGTDRCIGTACELAAPVEIGCTLNTQCPASQTCFTDVGGVCLPCLAGDSSCDTADQCPADPLKTAPGMCGCGVADTDGDGDGSADCVDLCPTDPGKIAAGVCGCNTADTDGDGDGTPNCNDLCPTDPGKIAAGICGCNTADTDGDGDGTPNCKDLCPTDPGKIAAGVCGCGTADTDGDGDGTPNCNDLCPTDPGKIAAGVCGCGIPDTDGNGNGTPDCNDFQEVLLSESDKSSNVHVSDDGLELRITNTLSDGGVRSTESVASGSGVWYFEMTQIGITGAGNFYAGVGTGATALDQTIGSTTTSVGMGGNGIVWYDGNFIGNFGHSDTIGFVVDYRGANPIVHIIAYEWEESAVRHKRTLPVTAPVFAMFVGQAAQHGEIARFNFGADTENHPFVHDVAAALDAAGDSAVADALVLGFGSTRALPHSDPPVLMVDADLSVAVNTPVMLSATAIDTEDGSLTSEIQWENLAESYYVRQRGTGGTFSFTPTEIGKYPIHVLVKDSVGVVSEETIMVTVTGTLPQFDPVRLVINDDTGAGISLSPDGLSAHFTVNEKMAVHANQGNYGRFWYFEAQRLNDASFSLGTGLVVSKGSLDPLSFYTTQPSLQVNFLGSAWRDLVFQANTPSSSGYYGFAVDYRGDHPTIYIIVDDAVIYSTTLEHVWVPLYPMLYGNSAPGPYDNTLNFGATPFQFDAAAALSAAGVSTSGFQPYWGDANAP